MAKRTYSEKSKRQALKIYQAAGPAEASRSTGFPASTIATWARKRGLKCEGAIKTKAATEAKEAAFAARRAQLKETLLDRIEDLNSRMDHRHKEFRGQSAKEVWYDSAPSDACKAYATSIGILYDKLRKECGEGDPAPSRQDGSEDAKDQIGEYVEALQGAVAEAWAKDEQ